MPAHRDPPLTVDEIVETALTLTAEHGLGALTMRAVAGAVGVTQMSLYHHLGDKGALLDLVADAVVAGVPTPAADLPWDRWLVEYHDALWKRLDGYPGLARHLLDHPDTPAGAAIRRATVDLLVDRGFGERDALLASSTFHTHLLGRLAIEAIPATAAGGHGEPSWRSHGLSAADYTAHGVRTVIEGLRALHG
ncbi:MAG: TetR/AcrR family transcriptional regulator [Acidimicrobiia bacterium]